MGKGRSDKEGHVRYNKHLGVHEARMYVPEKLRHLYNGQRTVSFHHKLEHKAIEKRAAAKREMDEGRGRARGITFGPYLEQWLEALKALQLVGERTLQDYRYWSEKHLIPALGLLPLDDLTAEEFDSLYARLAKKGMGARGINHVHATARVALQRAVKKRLIPYNPVKDADPPPCSTAEREYLTLSEEDVTRFVAARGDRYEALWVVAVLSGMRPAELRGSSGTTSSCPRRGRPAPSRSYPSPSPR